ncbi:MAG: T9SS type A sorting domain-containing protein, partial [Cytophagales bacterium]
TAAEEHFELPAASYTLDVNLSSNGAAFKSYTADVTSLAGKSGIILASGFVNPSANSNGESFGLFLVLADGGSFIALPEVPTSFKDITFNTGLIAPNPATDVVYVNTSNNENIQVLNTMGNLVMQTNNNVLNVANLNAGIYFVKVGNKTEKLVVR